ncbi:hypothetical protein M409DRAFT_53802 [Zasmidium cellare ATCC 36951]|uniref:Cytochrome P450 monooxygenase n=1 Tax=Zasmidium cellare ATCC 36951 TaxID=1080233 RepID=A0A6A6CMJ5_ZASCE|nr:uncharacterized protein M409DRAFT_53802 [Zasmidium cellare ATCC 36951]KAF2167843.1 hypothetical protein M409DRAFT_53802 [Zasmidium cellare ATCC 36951]
MGIPQACRKDFYILGQKDTTTKRIDVGPAKGIDHLRKGVAAEYGVIVPDGVAFHDADDSLDTLEDVLDCREPVGISVDGNLVRDPPGPKGLPFVGNYFEIYPDHLGNTARLHSQLGNVVQTNILGRRSYQTNDPRVASVVFAENGNFTKAPSQPGHPLYGLRDQSSLFLCDTSAAAFKVSHKFVPPSMSPKAVKHYSPAVQQRVRESFAVFDELEDQGQAFNVYHYMTKMAGQVICELVLGWDVKHFTTKNAPVHEIISTLGKYLQLNRKVQTKGDWYQCLPFGDPAELAKVRKHLYGLVEAAVEGSKRGGSKDLPIHSAALEASSIVDYLARATDDKGEKLPHEYILSNTIALLGAGFVTSSSFLSWLLYALVSYPGEQQKLLQELVDVLPEEAFTPHAVTGAIDVTSFLTYEAIQKMTRLDHFAKETQRLHSPSFQPARNTLRECIVPGGYRIPADSIITPAMPSLHTNSEYWADPQQFQPERWASDMEHGEKRHKSAYVPFAAGPRGCVGFNLALLEVKIVLAAWVARYHTANAGEEPVIYDPEFLVVRPMNFYASASKRTSWPRPSAEFSREGVNQDV